MKPIVNIDAFRQYYKEATSCKTVLNTNADTLALDDERRLEALLPIYDEYGRDMVKRLIVNAVNKDSRNYSEQVRKWADNSVVSMFIYETDNVLADYMPDYLSEAAVEAIAKNLIEKEKNKIYLKSRENTEYEVICNDKYCTFARFENEGIPLYAVCPSIPEKMEILSFSDNNIKDTFFSYIEAKSYYNKIVENNERSDKVGEILDKQYKEFKDEMLLNDSEKIYHSCYKICAVEDVYNYLTECIDLTEKQQNYIINSGENVLMNLAEDWYEYGDYNDNINIHVAQAFNEMLGEIENSEEYEPELE